MRKKGFTLTEVLIVVVIAITVTAFAVPAYKRTQDKANYTAALGWLMQIGSAVQALRMDMQMEGLNYSFPTSSSTVIVDTAWNTTDSTVQSALTLGAVGKDNAKLGKALVQRNYMAQVPAYTFHHYNFIVCPTGTASNSYCCSNESEAVVCMMDTSYSTRSTKAYWKAVYFNDGTIRRYEGS